MNTSAPPHSQRCACPQRRRGPLAWGKLQIPEPIPTPNPNPSKLGEFVGGDEVNLCVGPLRLRAKGSLLSSAFLVASGLLFHIVSGISVAT